MEVLLCERVNDLRHSLFHLLNCLLTTASKFFSLSLGINQKSQGRVLELKTLKRVNKIIIMQELEHIVFSLVRIYSIRYMTKILVWFRFFV